MHFFSTESQPPPLVPIHQKDPHFYKGPLTPPTSTEPSPSPPHHLTMPGLTPVPITEEAPKKRKRGRTRGNGPTLLPCSVCGDLAPDHQHYGGVACFSCRAFFRRSVNKAHLYECQEQRQCHIDVTSRRHCQYCRYEKCLRSGMKPTWVLNEQEKRERNMRKKLNAAKKAHPNTAEDDLKGKLFE